MGFHKRNIANWGNYPKVEAEVSSPEFMAELCADFSGDETLLPRGNGRCYGDAALHSRVISMTGYNKILAFDPGSGLLQCQAGTLLSDILDFCVPKGFFIPVTPGTRFITVGGAIAADVHGKNHHVEGCFSHHLDHLLLLDEHGKTVRCSATENTGLFWETAGGMGLTGIILETGIYLKPIETAYIRQESIKAKNLDEIMELFERSMDWTYSVAWIDCLQKGKKQGRSILMRGEHAKRDELPARYRNRPFMPKKKANKKVPFHLPRFTLNKWSVKAFNFLYYHKQFQKQKNSITDYHAFFYPLDGILEWNRIYGKNGFTQYQFVLPPETGKEGLISILNTIRKSGQGSFLAVLKWFGKSHPQAVNSFPMQGYTLALDFKIHPQLPPLLRKLDGLVHQYGGRVYLAKDAFSDPKVFAYVKDVRRSKFYSAQYERLFDRP